MYTNKSTYNAHPVLMLKFWLKKCAFYMWVFTVIKSVSDLLGYFWRNWNRAEAESPEGQAGRQALLPIVLGMKSKLSAGNVFSKLPA